MELRPPGRNARGLEVFGVSGIIFAVAIGLGTVVSLFLVQWFLDND
jgi:hypothetical protein